MGFSICSQFSYCQKSPEILLGGNGAVSKRPHPRQMRLCVFHMKQASTTQLYQQLCENVRLHQTYCSGISLACRSLDPSLPRCLTGRIRLAFRTCFLGTLPHRCFGKMTRVLREVVPNGQCNNVNDMVGWHPSAKPCPTNDRITSWGSTVFSSMSCSRERIPKVRFIWQEDEEAYE